MGNDGDHGFLNGKYEGLYNKINRLYLNNKDITSLSKKKQDIIQNYMHQNGTKCDKCNGTRLNPNKSTFYYNIQGKNIYEFCQLQLTELVDLVSKKD